MAAFFHLPLPGQSYLVRTYTENDGLAADGEMIYAATDGGLSIIQNGVSDHSMNAIHAKNSGMDSPLLLTKKAG